MEKLGNISHMSFLSQSASELVKPISSASDCGCSLPAAVFVEGCVYRADQKLKVMLRDLPFLFVCLYVYLFKLIFKSEVPNSTAFFTQT